MRNVKKKVVAGVVAFCILLTLLFGMFKNVVIRKVLCSRLESQTGFEVELDGLRYNPLKTTITLSGFRLKNPEDFGNSVALEIKRLYIDTSLKSLFSDEVWLQECDIDIDRIHIVTNPDGESNIDRLANRLQQNVNAKIGGKIPPSAARAGTGLNSGDAFSPSVPPVLPDESEITIGKLKIRLGKVVMQSSSVAGSESPQEVYVIDKTFKFNNVDDLDPVTQQLMIAILISTGPDLLEAF